MNALRTILTILLLTALGQEISFAQESGIAPPSNIRGAQYPKITPDHRVLFGIKAPNAQRVEFNLGKLYPAQKNAEGLWTATTDPQAVGFHYYWVVIDGVQLNDPSSETFYGTVDQVRMNATIIQNVVTYNTTIAFDNPDLRLFPGMTAYVSIPVAEAKNVVKIPNGALRFKPDLTDSQIKALYAKYSIQEAQPRAPGAGRLAAGGDTTGASAGANGATPGGVGAGGGQARAQGQGGSGGGGGNRRAQAQDSGDAAAAVGGGGQGGGRRGGGNSQRVDSGVVWKLLPDKTLEPVQVSLGVTDFTFTAMVSGKLSPNDDLIIGQASGKPSTAAQARNPVGPGGGPGGPGVPRRF